MTATVILIPARYGSTRFPGKPLAPLKGATGEVKPLIQRSYEAAVAATGVTEVYVTTDDDRIAEAAEGFGAPVIMTSSDCRNGTERCAEALTKLHAPGPEIVVNVQGDAPLTPAWYVEDLVAGLRAGPEMQAATPVIRASGEQLAKLRADRQAGRVGGTTAVFDARHRALYFSKEVLPFAPDAVAPHAPSPVFHHVGVYAYRPAALEAYRDLEPGELEQHEGLEQLRFLENGIDMLCVEVDPRTREFWELNNPSDIEIIEDIMAREGIA